jgi:hypothetical protein
MINPRGVKIVANTVGFFIANDAEEVRRANAFCKVRKRARFVVVFVGLGGWEFLKDSMCTGRAQGADPPPPSSTCCDGR